MADISNITVSVEGVNTVCEIKDKVARNDIAINRTTLGYQCKNLLKNTAVTKTVNGVTFTVNSDGSITAKQTTTAPGNATIDVATNITLNPGTYILTGDDEIKKSGYGEIRFYINGTIYAANTAHTFDEEVTISAVRIFVWSGVNINGSKTIYPMLRYADITDDTYEPYKENVNKRLIKNKSDIAMNKSTLGYQRKNLFDWKNANVDNSNNATYTKTDNDITTTSNGSWARVVYKLPALDIGTKYTFSAAVSDLSQASATARIRIAYNLEGTNKIIDINLTEDGKYKADFTPTESTVYVLFYPNFSANTYTNSFTASNIMLRYADILDDTYEPYQPSLKEQVPYSISLPSKSTSESYSYNGVPTMICLTPSESVSSGGGLYLINSVGTAVYLIDKTGIVINTDTTNKTFTITNNTASTYDVYISCAYKKE